MQQKWNDGTKWKETQNFFTLYFCSLFYEHEEYELKYFILFYTTVSEYYLR